MVNTVTITRMHLLEFLECYIHIFKINTGHTILVLSPYVGYILLTTYGEQGSVHIGDNFNPWFCGMPLY
jgi:hypothetical protein